ncbi:PTS systemcellobiose-specific IIC component [Vibrio maritimus]|uniref:PTS systemcellobiose-specific IIC component n=1 Tax=Vibrio maritimus TaxID=990268 RepID=A0A090T010_9VIBR|nr:PTS systemcellobiose-specific IIC component [Vibrio maritimus]
MNPVAKLLMRSQHLMAMRDGFQLAMPFIFVGCMFVPIIFPPFADSESWMSMAWMDLSLALRPILLPTYQLTLGVVGLSFPLACRPVSRRAINCLSACLD